MSTRFKAIPPTSTQARPSTWVGRILRADQLSLIPRSLHEWKKRISSLSISLAVHAFLLFILSWFYFDIPHRIGWNSNLTLVGSDQDSFGDGTDFDLQGSNERLGMPADGEQTDELMATDDLLGEEDSQFVIATLNNSLPVTDRSSNTGNGGAAPGKPNLSKSGGTKKSGKSSGAATNAGMNGQAEAGGVHTDHFKGRGPMAKRALLKRMGGTDASEAAVARGLEWIKNHQMQDGSWNFYHLLSPRCDCSMPGSMDNNPNAATAMALLAFLGAGHTQQEGLYKPEVQKGIEFLLGNSFRADKGICFYGPSTGQPMYYTHGLVTIALSEALAMTGDQNLRPAVSGAIDFLVSTQESGGGWRYFPGQPGDTSVVAWELMALKSAQFSRMQVPQKVFRGVERFLNSVSSMRGSQFAYTPERQGLATPSMTAAGLLCKMYLNATEGSAGLQAGVHILDRQGPDPDAMYYNYYATQVMHHWGGPEWDRWNNLMRDHLVNTQILDGHATGSWNVADRHGHVGGRLYMTSLAVLTLEVYYRHLPLYRKDRIDLPLLDQAADEKKP